MNKGMSIEAALAELQKPLNGRNAKTWAFGPAVRTLIAALEQAQQRIANPDKWTRDLEETLIAATDRNTELEARIAELDRKNCQLNSTMESWCVDRAESANRITELEASKLSAAASDVMSERHHQITAEGWTPESDDEYVSGEMAGAAACYAHHVNARGWVFKNRPDDYQSEIESSDWPWSPEWWEPTSPRRDLVKAGALIIAEIERIDRAAGGRVEGSD